MENNDNGLSEERGHILPDSHKRRHIEFMRAIRDSREEQRLRLQPKHGDRWQFYRFEEDKEEMELMTEYYYN